MLVMICIGSLSRLIVVHVITHHHHQQQHIVTGGPMMPLLRVARRVELVLQMAAVNLKSMRVMGVGGGHCCDKRHCSWLTVSLCGHRQWMPSRPGEWGLLGYDVP